jgi:hypothetical protein
MATSHCRIFMYASARLSLALRLQLTPNGIRWYASYCNAPAGKHSVQQSPSLANTLSAPDLLAIRRLHCLNRKVVLRESFDADLV